MSGKPTISGTSKGAKKLRRKLFFDAYQTNGNNATQAAIAAGASPTSAHTLGCRWLKEMSGAVDQAAQKRAYESGLSVERWEKEMAAIGHVDPGAFYRPDGTLIPLHELPEHVRRAVGRVETRTRYHKDGEETVTQTIYMHDKNAALANIGKHLGLFEKDNTQRQSPIQIAVQLVG